MRPTFKPKLTAAVDSRSFVLASVSVSWQQVETHLWLIKCTTHIIQQLHVPYISWVCVVRWNKILRESHGWKKLNLLNLWCVCSSCIVLQYSTWNELHTDQKSLWYVLLNLYDYSYSVFLTILTGKKVDRIIHLLLAGCDRSEILSLKNWRYAILLIYYTTIVLTILITKESINWLSESNMACISNPAVLKWPL